jgi:ribosome-associated protein
MSKDLFVTSKVTIPAGELSWTAVRSSGPGGQNVNKLSTKVELRWDLSSSRALDGPAKSRLRAIAAGRSDAGGRLLLTSQATRSQEQNLEDARNKLAELVRRALVVPKKRRATAPSRASRRKRVEHKRQHSQKKQARGRVRSED